MFLILALYAMFASTFILGKEAVSVVPPIFFIGIRMILAGSLLMIFLWVWKKEHPRVTKRQIPWFIGIIFFHIYCAYVLEYISLQYLTSAKTCLLYNLSPFITAVLSYFIFKEIMTMRKWLGLIIGFAAFLPTLIAQTSAEEGLGELLGVFSYAEIILLISITSSCVGWIFMRKLTRDFQHSYFFVNTVGMLGGGILALGTSLYTETLPHIPTLLTNSAFLYSLFGLIFIGNIVCYNLYGKLLHTYSTTALSFFGFFTPIFAALFGWIWFKEPVSWSFFVTIGLVVCGLYLFYKEELKLGYIIKQ